MKLSHSFEEVKAENSDLKNSLTEPSAVELGEADSLKIELSKLTVENELLRKEFSELKAEIESLNELVSSWNQSSRSLHKLEGETSTQSHLAHDKFNKMSFVKANVVYDPCESMTYNDQIPQKLNHKVKAGIGFQKPENSKPRWLKNKLDKDKAKAGRKSFVPNQSWRSSKKVKSGWKKVQQKRDLSGQSMKSKLNRSHSTYAQTLMDYHTGKAVKGQIFPSVPVAGGEAMNAQPDDTKSDVAPKDVAQAVASASPLVLRPTSEVPAASTNFQLVSSPPAGQQGASTSCQTVSRPTVDHRADTSTHLEQQVSQLESDA
ncbi:hypothetical protein F511_14648 [Dorcoceras hygrometricum]|uniref:Uncharacterized protein n=1 Tax=Dorcoceras hygrometricum TaxID=472368 RepID=A0A2Z7AUK5_9LAMI|nr:hypothetical protein F511_14648 [Dorcoceras hygrometricum]